MSQPPSYPPGQGHGQGHPADRGEAPNPQPHTGAMVKAFTAAAVAGLALVGLLFVVSGLPESSEAAGRVIGRLTVAGAFAAVATGVIAKKSRALWRWWHYYVLTVPLMVVTPALS